MCCRRKPHSLSLKLQALATHSFCTPQAVENYLFVERDFGLPSFGVSNVPEASVVAHPGVWEDARHAYVHEVLIRLHSGDP